MTRSLKLMFEFQNIIYIFLCAADPRALRLWVRQLTKGGFSGLNRFNAMMHIITDLGKLTDHNSILSFFFSYNSIL